MIVALDNLAVRDRMIVGVPPFFGGSFFEGAVMDGVVRSRDILAHPIATIRGFGWRVFFRAILPWQHEPFLSLIQKSGRFRATGLKCAADPASLHRLGIACQRIYDALGRALDEQGPVALSLPVWRNRSSATPNCLDCAKPRQFMAVGRQISLTPGKTICPASSNKWMRRKRPSIQSTRSTRPYKWWFRLNRRRSTRSFHAALAATDGVFVKKLKPFREAMEAHMSYIVERLPEFSPRLLQATRELRARFPRVGS